MRTPDLKSLMEILENTPPTLMALLNGLSEDWTNATEGENSWSPHLVVAHLLQLETTSWIQRAEVILRQDPQSAFQPVDRNPERWERSREPLLVLLKEFAKARRENLSILASWELTEEQLELSGSHPTFGSVKLRQLLATWATHDLAHLAQIIRVLARRNAEAVGPWRPLLPILGTN